MFQVEHRPWRHSVRSWREEWGLMSFSSVRGAGAGQIPAEDCLSPCLGPGVNPTGKLKSPGVLCHVMLSTTPLTPSPTRFQVAPGTLPPHGPHTVCSLWLEGSVLFLANFSARMSLLDLMAQPSPPKSLRPSSNLYHVDN